MKAVSAARLLLEQLADKRYTLVLAESCTAGLVSDLITRISGASAVLWGSYVCYSPSAKQRMLGLDEGTLKQYGLVSRETAREMAFHALNQSGASIAASVTGIAGPLGDGGDSPVGLVWTAVAHLGMVREKKFQFEGTRSEIRMQAAAAVLEELLDFIQRSA